MSAGARSSRAPLQFPLSSATTCPPYEEAASSSCAESSAGFRTRCRCGEAVTKDRTGPQLLGLSHKSGRSDDSSAAENDSQQNACSSLNAHEPHQFQKKVQRHQQQGRQQKEGEREYQHPQQQRKACNSLCLEAIRRSSFFPSRRRWCACVFASLAFFVVAIQHFIHDDSTRAGITFSLISSHFFSSPYAFTVLHPIFSLLPAPPSSFPLSQTSSLSGGVTNSSTPRSAVSPVDAADAGIPSTAAADGFLSDAAPSGEPAAAVAVDSDGRTTAGRSASKEKEAITATAREGRPERPATGERVGGAAARKEAVAVEEFVHLSSNVDASGIELYSYRRAGGGLTLVHDAAAEGPAAAPAGHRVAARLPPFTQGLIASPFQPPVPLRSAGATAFTASAGEGEAALPQGRGSQRGSGFLTPAEDCLSRFGGSSVLLETSGLYGQSYIREFDFCTGETVRQLYLHPALFAEGAAFLWEPQHQQLLLLVLTWRERLLLVLHAETWKFIGALTVDFEGWGLASNLATADAVAAVALVKERRAAAASSDAAAAVAFTADGEDGHAGEETAAAEGAGEAAAAGAARAAAATSLAEARAAALGGPTVGEAAAVVEELGGLLEPPRKRNKVEAAVLPIPLQQRLKQQRLWATTGSDVLLELDVPRLLESVRQLPRFAAVAAAAAEGPTTKLRNSTKDASAAVSGVVNEEGSSKEAAAHAAVGAAARRRGAPRETRTGHEDARAVAEQAGSVSEQTAAAGAAVAGEGSRARESGEGWVSAAPFAVQAAGGGAAAGEVEEVLAAAAGSRGVAAVGVVRKVALRCLGSPLPMLNELEYVPGRKSLLANIYGAFFLAEVDVDSGACKSLGSFGGLEGALRSANEYDRVMNGIALLPPRVAFPSPVPPASAAAAESAAAAAAVHEEPSGGEAVADLHVSDDASPFSPTTLLANSARSVVSPFAVLYSLLLHSSPPRSAAVPAAASSAAASSPSEIVPVGATVNVGGPAGAASSDSALTAAEAGAPAAGAPYPSALLLTGKQWSEFHFVEILQLHQHNLHGRGDGGSSTRIDSYPAVEAAYPGFFSRHGLQSHQRYPPP